MFEKPGDRKADSPSGPVVLCILDGWGYRAEAEDNAIALADTPSWERLLTTAPHSFLNASDRAVGLPDGQMGNSEVGHVNLGAGRVVMQDLPRIDAAVADGSLAGNPVLGEFVSRLKSSGGCCHLMGLLSPGGVHSHQDHIAALARAVAERGVPVALHAFLDGRDTPPRSAPGYLRRLQNDVNAAPGVRVATVSGRYYAMDRDKRWERVTQAYDALVSARGTPATNADAAIAANHAADVGDEFVVPAVIGDYSGMKDGDGIMMANFRADRAREILTALLDPDFDGVERRIRFATACGMVSYSESLNRLMTALFPPQSLSGTLPEVVSAAGLRQLRIAETEKYAHVTFFLNGGDEKVFPGEERILVPSPKIPTYDLKPEMSAFEVTAKLVETIKDHRFDLIVVNYANADMVGHSGDLAAAIRAVEALDTCLGRLIDAVIATRGSLIVTADHGNAELMRDPVTGQPHTAHTSNPVPFVLLSPPGRNHSVKDGCLADVAPTVLNLLDLPQPAEMTGRTLIAATSAVSVHA